MLSLVLYHPSDSHSKTVEKNTIKKDMNNKETTLAKGIKGILQNNNKKSRSMLKKKISLALFHAFKPEGQQQ